MATDRQDERQLIVTPLIESAHNGFGAAEKIDEFKYNRVYGSIDARWPGQIRAGFPFQETEITTGTGFEVPVFAATWENSSGVEFLLYLGRSSVRRLVGTGGDVSYAAYAGTSVSPTGGMLDDDGSGVPYLYIAFGGRSTDFLMQRMNRAATVTEAVDVRAQKLLSLNARAYRSVTPTGGTANCAVSSIGRGSDRTTAANWGQALVVGFAGNEINNLASVRQSPIALKPEGIFAYSEGLDRWINMTPAWEKFPHPDNGIAYANYQDELAVALGDGGVVLFDGYRVRPIDPLPMGASSPNEHTTRGPIRAMGATRNWLIAATDSASKRSMSPDETLFYDNDGVFSDISANLRDADYFTTSAITITAADVLYVGAARPFTAVHFAGTAFNNNTVTMTGAVSQSDGTFATLNTVDLTSAFSSSGATAPFGISGAIVMTQDPINALSWARASVNGTTLYWMRLTFSGALDAITLHTMKINQWYPPVDTTNFGDDGLDRSGCFPHVLFGRDTEDNFVWHDMGNFTVPDVPGVIIHGISGKSIPPQERNIAIIGRQYHASLSIGLDDRPGVGEMTPRLHPSALIEGSAFEPAPGKACRLVSVRVEGAAFDPDFPGRFYYTWDWGKPWSRLGVVTQPPAELVSKDTSIGNKFRWAWGWSQSAITARKSVPYIKRIEATFEVLDVPLDRIQEREIPDTSPPRF